MHLISITNILGLAGFGMPSISAQSSTTDMSSTIAVPSQTITTATVALQPDDSIRNAQGQTATAQFPVETLAPGFTRQISVCYQYVKMTTECDGSVGIEVNLRPFPALPPGDRFTFYLTRGSLVNGDCNATGPVIRHGELSAMVGGIPALSDPYAATFVTPYLSFDTNDAAVFVGGTILVVARPDGVPVTCAPVEVMTPYIPYVANMTQSLCVSVASSSMRTVAMKTGSGTQAQQTGTRTGTGVGSGDMGFGAGLVSSAAAGFSASSSSGRVTGGALVIVLLFLVGVSVV
ncbi:hypothetical protein BCR37DRAFT_162499 [Protomyces lactucae-debilis]|uniref:Uncharacterized protein n=1 Tax=Protomyces lactucae-debilis TaxID=2754530 RepID=A0A1Y2EYF7_PROLT|nr:uncharacterized protein BCR37DRAFT_162499 [Protomyces lactucae-debilis]ORY76639.1 hypothetical protein BCR37DRAFT_162499 [Protomyces lactucae-debilis]